jgi:hypothetical protein
MKNRIEYIRKSLLKLFENQTDKLLNIQHEIKRHNYIGSFKNLESYSVTDLTRDNLLFIANKLGKLSATYNSLMELNKLLSLFNDIKDEETLQRLLTSVIKAYNIYLVDIHNRGNKKSMKKKEGFWYSFYNEYQEYEKCIEGLYRSIIQQIKSDKRK